MVCARNDMCIESVNNEMADDRVEENMFEED